MKELPVIKCYNYDSTRTSVRPLRESRSVDKRSVNYTHSQPSAFFQIFRILLYKMTYLQSLHVLTTIIDRIIEIHHSSFGTLVSLSTKNTNIGINDMTNIYMGIRYSLMLMQCQ